MLFLKLYHDERMRDHKSTLKHAVTLSVRVEASVGATSRSLKAESPENHVKETRYFVVKITQMDAPKTE